MKPSARLTKQRSRAWQSNLGSNSLRDRIKQRPNGIIPLGRGLCGNRACGEPDRTALTRGAVEPVFRLQRKRVECHLGFKWRLGRRYLVR
jgi:hypothetical protein